MRQRYFDHAATTPLDGAVLAAMLPWMTDEYANAHSLHEGGARARAAVEKARAQVAAAIGAEDPEQIVFTSGATEAANWALSLRQRWAVSPFEHAAVRGPALEDGATILDHRGPVLHPSDAPAVAVMAVSNETGTCFDVREVAGPAAFRFVDATQALGKTKIDLTSVDAAAFSAHKLYGPKGVGALYLAEGFANPWMRGGGQEGGRRAGTLNVPGIVGFGAAAELAAARWMDDAMHAAILSTLVTEIVAVLPDARIVTGPESVSSILALSFEGVHGAAVIQAVDEAGFAISAGPACSSDSTDASPGLLAMGLSEGRALGTVRVSFGRGNTPDSAAALGREIVRAVRALRG